MNALNTYLEILRLGAFASFATLVCAVVILIVTVVKWEQEEKFQRAVMAQLHWQAMVMAPPLAWPPASGYVQGETYSAARP